MPFPAIEYCCTLCERMVTADRLPDDGLCQSCRDDEERFERRRADARRRAETDPDTMYDGAEGWER